ncbi:MAG TPA: HAD family hydrolase [Deltaproteobacteria bacterium]|nr:HAD family hydrolase [Deltaproteobacteria bacterium]
MAGLRLSDLNASGTLDGILCDIDDTLTWHGRLVPSAFAALAAAQARGLHVVPVTGRPYGWADHIARMWPVDGVVAENGGLWCWMTEARLERGFVQSAATRQENRARLDALAETILTAVPGTALASDQAFRALDLAIDFCEDVPPLPRPAIDRIVAAFESAGATCKVSSIHVNGWFGSFDKLAGFRRFHHDRYGTEPDLSRWVYFGDSANDAPMFRAFPVSVGVANVADFLDRMEHWPTHITKAPGGHGFAEAMNVLFSQL